MELDPVTRALDARTARTEGSFDRWNLSWQRLQPLGASFSLYLSASAQAASKNLDSSQKMSLGGIQGVRAYPQNEAPGDQGYLATLEARYELPVPVAGAWQIAAFADTGHVRQNRDPWTAAPNSRTLSGFGIGIHAALPRQWFVRAALAHRIGSARPTSDADRRLRLWLQAAALF